MHNIYYLELSGEHRCPLGYSFLILGLRIFFQNIKVGGGEKIKIKITKKIFFIESETYLDQRKKNNKNCMILHCKSAEMTMPFYSVKSYNFCYFFLIFKFFLLIWQFLTLEKMKKVKNKMLFFFLKWKNLGRRILKPRNKKKIALTAIPLLTQPVKLHTLVRSMKIFI